MDIGALFPSFDVDITGIIKAVKENNYSNVLLQVPEGLKPGAVELASLLEKETGAQVFVDGELCYGACDHAGSRANLIDMDAVIHLGHADIPSMKNQYSVPIHFFPTSMKIDMGPLFKGLDEVLSKIESDRIGLATTVQHLRLLRSVKEELKKQGKIGVVGAPGNREEYEGQVLGCSFQSPRSIKEEVGAFLYIGTGRFHPIGMVNAVKKPVFAVDPMTGAVSEYGQKDLDDFLRKRWGAVSASKEKFDRGARVGIILGTKPGQMRWALAGKLRENCDEEGLNCSIVVMDHLEPMKLRSLGIDIAVVTACPRIAYDDISRYIAENVVVLTYNELLIAIGKEKWEDYSFDEKW
jgi:2-(3-amino-3-carboxypropyl)histidine synthase